MGYSVVNGAALIELASLRLRDTLVQGVLPIEGRGFDPRWLTDYNGASVDIALPKITGKGGRMIGATVNGGFMNSNYASLDSTVTSLPLSFVYDEPKIIAQNVINQTSPELLTKEIDNMVKAADRMINTAYVSTLLANVLNKGIKATSSGGTVSYTKDTNYITSITADTAAGALDALFAAGANLDAGDSANGFDYFDKQARQLFVKSAYKAKLMGNSGVFVGNYLGQQMLANGALSPEAQVAMKRGYVGEVDGAACTLADSVFGFAKEWLRKTTISDNTSTEIGNSFSHIAGLLVAGEGVVGAIDRRSEVKVVDARGGQGYELQPLVRCGFALFSDKAVQLIEDKTGITATDFITATGSGNVATVTVKTSVLPLANRN